MDKKIKLSDYVERWEAIHKQYKLGAWAIDHLSKDNIGLKEFYQIEAEEHTRLKLDDGTIKSEEGKKIINYVENRLKDASSELSQTSNRIRQNMLILNVSLFESFIKDIHRCILYQEPTLLKPQRQIPLGQLISQGFEEILQNEIEREVYSLDRKSLSEKAEYFKKRLDIPWSKGGFMGSLQKYFDLRNILLHEDPELLFSNKQVEDNAIACIVIAVNLFGVALRKYPGGFIYPE